MPVKHVAIEIDQPLPPERGPGRSRYDWDKMKVGGRALFFAGREWRDVWTLAKHAGKRHNMKFVVRKITYEGSDGIGVWRTE